MNIPWHTPGQIYTMEQHMKCLKELERQLDEAVKRIEELERGK